MDKKPGTPVNITDRSWNAEGAKNGSYGSPFHLATAQSLWP